MPTLRDIAREAGVSVATVSRALNHLPTVSPELRDRVMGEAQRIGYKVPAPPRAKCFNRLGIAYPGVPINPEFGGYDAGVLAGAMRGSFESGFDIAVVNMLADRRHDESFAEFFHRKGVDGVLVRTFTGRRHICEQIAAEGFPHVVIGDRFDDPNVNYVCYDSEREASAAVEHLVHLGHRRVALCMHSVHDSDHLKRRAVYENVLASHGLQVSPELVVEVIADLAGGASAINRLMSLAEPPTAIFFTDPLSAVGGLRRALERNIRVPDDLSIIGYDDGEIRRFTNPVCTAICGDASELAAVAAGWLVNVIREHKPGSPATSGGLRLAREARFEVNHTTAGAPSNPVRVSPNGDRLDS